MKLSTLVLTSTLSGAFATYVPSSGIVFPWMADPNADPTKRAAALLNEMNLTEKLHMLHGSGRFVSATHEEEYV